MYSRSCSRTLFLLTIANLVFGLVSVHSFTARVTVSPLMHDRPSCWHVFRTNEMAMTRRMTHCDPSGPSLSRRVRWSTSMHHHSQSNLWASKENASADVDGDVDIDADSDAESLSTKQSELQEATGSDDEIETETNDKEVVQENLVQFIQVPPSNLYSSKTNASLDDGGDLDVSDDFSSSSVQQQQLSELQREEQQQQRADGNGFKSGGNDKEAPEHLVQFIPPPTFVASNENSLSAQEQQQQQQLESQGDEKQQKDNDNEIKQSNDTTVPENLVQFIPPASTPSTGTYASSNTASQNIPTESVLSSPADISRLYTRAATQSQREQPLLQDQSINEEYVTIGQDKAERKTNDGAAEQREGKESGLSLSEDARTNPSLTDAKDLPSEEQEKGQGQQKYQRGRPMKRPFRRIGRRVPSSLSSISNKNNDYKNGTETFTKKASRRKSSITSLGSFLLKRKQIEENEIEKLKYDSNSTRGIKGTRNIDELASFNVLDPGSTTNDTVYTSYSKPDRIGDTIDFQEVAKDIPQTVPSGTQSISNPNEETRNSSKVGKIEESKEQLKHRRDDLKVDKGFLRTDPEKISDVDEAVSILTGSGSLLGISEIMTDIEVLPGSSRGGATVSGAAATTTIGASFLSQSSKVLPLSDSRHSARIEVDMRRLAVSIASGIENEEQWRIFCEDGGGLLPLLECIRDGAREVRQSSILMRHRKRMRFNKVISGRVLSQDLGINELIGEQEAAFDAACEACKTLRDLSVISKPFSAMVTDGVLRTDAFWATGRMPGKAGEEKQYGGVISDLVDLLKYSAELDGAYRFKIKSDGVHTARETIGNRNVLPRRRQRKATRQRYALHVVQFLLAMSFASDKAVDRFRATVDFTETILSCSSYAKKERLRRRWVKYPIEIIKRKLSKGTSDEEIVEDPFLTAASVTSGIAGQIQGVCNQLLAAIGYNVWYPKTVGQKGLRILSLDGGGARGISAISSMRSIVDALDGIEVCDAFDMIVGTSTGAIIAFLVGLKRESSSMARKRYDHLIKQIFIKSALSTPMLLFTTASYDESPFNKVMLSVLGEHSMLASRADPRVPLVFAVSTKMSSTPTQLCLFRNYNYKGGEMSDAFVLDPIDAKEELKLPFEDDIYKLCGHLFYDENLHEKTKKPSLGSRHAGSFRVLQRAALRATTAAPTVFKPVLMGGELYCDGGIVASNPAAVAIHEARTIFPDVQIELIVSCGTGAFVEEKSEPRIGWDGIIGQIVNSATDGEQTHHILEDILGQGSTAHLGKSSISKTKYYRFNPLVGTADAFPIDETSPIKLEQLSRITTAYMDEPEQRSKIDEIVSILNPKSRWRRLLDP